jgi:hypothetical protein
MRKQCQSCSNKPAKGRSLCYSCYGKKRRGTLCSLPRYPMNPTKMKILFLDIETKPAIVYTWSLFNANIGIEQIIEPGGMICFAAGWLDEEKVEFYSEWQHGHQKMIEQAWNLLDECDIVIHYYGSQFDIKHLNAEFLKNGFPPPSPFKQIDLKLAVSKQFKLDSNKLQFVSQVLGIEGKEEHEGFRLWAKVLNGDDDARTRMQSYNERDTVLLKECFEILLPWLPNIPNRRLYDGQGGCPSCGHAELSKAGYAYTKTSRFEQFKCNKCYRYFRSSKRDLGIEIQSSLLGSVL